MESELTTPVQHVERPDLGQLTIGGVELSYTALRVTNADLSYEDFEGIVRAAGRFKTASSWWLGDLLNFGERLYGDRYADAMELSGLKYETLSNYAWVCRRVARSRRRDQLEFSHHSAVASLEPAEQNEWLDAAIANGWNVEELRGAIRASRHAPPPPEQPRWTKDEVIEVLTPDAIDAACKAARKIIERPLSEGHPLWRTQAESAARDVISLARTAAKHPPAKEAAIKVMETAVVEGDGYRVPRETLDALIHIVLNGDE